VIRLRGVKKSFRDAGREVPILRGVDLEVGAGEMVAIVGPSGSGKSTLLYVAGALDGDFEGEAVVMLPGVLRRDGVEPLARVRARAAEALGEVGLGEKAPQPPARLSGGERQRVAIARALFARPRVLLADEPTGNLDAVTGEGIIRLFAELAARGLTVLVVTHEERVSRAASRVLHLAEGRLSA
jgi:putative ABC transport system ATP-binding protein